MSVASDLLERRYLLPVSVLGRGGFFVHAALSCNPSKESSSSDGPYFAEVNVDHRSHRCIHLSDRVDESLSIPINRSSLAFNSLSGVGWRLSTGLRSGLAIVAGRLEFVRIWLICGILRY